MVDDWPDFLARVWSFVADWLFRCEGDALVRPKRVEAALACMNVLNKALFSGQHYLLTFILHNLGTHLAPF